MEKKNQSQKCLFPLGERESPRPRPVLARCTGVIAGRGDGIRARSKAGDARTWGTSLSGVPPLLSRLLSLLSLRGGPPPRPAPPSAQDAGARARCRRNGRARRAGIAARGRRSDEGMEEEEGEGNEPPAQGKRNSRAWCGARRRGARRWRCAPSAWRRAPW